MTDLAVSDTKEASGQDTGMQPDTQGQSQGRAGLMSGAADQGAADGAGQGHNSGGHFDKNGDWRTGFAEGLDDSTKETWGKLSSRYTSPTDMAKAHVELVKTMDKRIPVPGENAKPEEWDGVFMKLGMPEKAEDYKFEFDGTGWDKDRQEQVKGLAPLFRTARATQSQVAAFVKHQAELDKASEDAYRAKAHDLSQSRMRELQQQWRGEDFKRNASLVKTTVETYAGPDAESISQMQLADGTWVVDHPAFARMFAKIGAERSEDNRDPTAFNTGMAQDIDAQILAIESEMTDKGITPTDKRYPHEKLEALYKRKPGNARNTFGSFNGR